jgi:hypothetical protein
MNYLENIELWGYAVIPNVVDDNAQSELIGDLNQALAKNNAVPRPGLRNLLSLSPRCREISQSRSLRSLIEPILGPSAKAVRGIYFDKQREANWKVAWHQDLTITVKQKVEIEGFGPWSLKGGITHVQPPASVLEQMLAVRLHLDETDLTNGALRVVPGTHRLGRLSAEDIQAHLKGMKVESCGVPKGGVMLMRPLLVHSSSTSQLLRRRRVIHLEYCAAQLPPGLEWYETFK